MLLVMGKPSNTPVKKICPSCKRIIRNSKAEFEFLKNVGTCSGCNHTQTENIEQQKGV